ncbi:Vacuolar morphogenesis protein [Spathaspora sp. JA1]|nr:Vacuolar morphogenesis protein [Spathaspora sp. JA1]
MSEIITITNEVEIDGSTYYQISIKLPLRSYVIKRRYSEFELLVTNLSNNLGINPRDFPYQLPAKRINWLNKSGVIEERKVELCKFLNDVIRDTSIQNNRDLLEFLQLPINFRFNNDVFKQDLSGLTADVNSITSDSWLEIYRKLKSEIHSSYNVSTIQEKIHTRDKINRVYQPAIVKLLQCLSTNKLDASEIQRRKTLITQLQDNLEEILTNDLHKTATPKRVLGEQKQAGETNQTIALSNQDLLQQQKQIHQAQDQELEQLRVLISKQRQIGEIINAEVEEQNYMLDKFNDEIEVSSDKVTRARQRARNIT